MEYTIKIEGNKVLLFDGDKEISSLLFVKEKDAFDIVSIHTDLAYQGQGLARKVLYYFIEYSDGAKIIPTCSYARNVLSKDDEIKNRLIDGE